MLEYKNNSKALADLMYEILEDSGLMYSEEKGSTLDNDGTKRCRYDEIDPISFMNRFEMYSDNNRIKLITKFQEKTGLNIEIPKDFDGLPSTNPRKSCVIRFKNDRKKEDVPNIWNLFEIAMNANFKNNEDTNNFILCYDRVVSKPCAKFNISIGLFKIRPDTFLNLDKLNRNFIERKLGIKIRKCPNGKEYLEIIDKVKKYIEESKKEDYYNENNFLEDVYIDQNAYKDLKELLLRKKNVILQGAPGVGKTYMAKRLAYSILGSKDDSKIKMIQFHQSYSYEEFVEGWKPNEEGYKIEEGIFYCIYENYGLDP